jgi:hypothetical protein
MSEEPVDPFLNQDMLPMAKSAHDMFVAFMSAGFTEGQSIQIVTGVITSALMSAPPSNTG